MRCIELTAFGLAKRTRRSGSSSDHAVADAGGVLELVVVLAEREAALGDHRREAVEGRQVELLELAEVAAEGGTGLPGDDRDHRPGVAHGDALHVRPLGRPEQRRVALDHLAGAEGACDERPRHLVDDRAHEVHRVDGLAGRRPDLGQHDRRLPSSPTTGASSRRSEKQRSESACHDAARRCT